MDLFAYLNLYQDTSLKEMAFNEIDALMMSLVAYVPFDELHFNKDKVKADELIKMLDQYVPPLNSGERKLKYLELLKQVCLCKRYEKPTFAYFRKERDDQSDKQFQAITIIFKDYIYISFSGTDSTTLGWKEDFNMAYLETVPSEISAVKYANEVSSRIWFKRIYLGGHSKGGRLAVSAAKGLFNKRRIKAIFAFDAPNFPSSCYDQNYKSIDSYVLAYAPNESIIGRLMMEYHQKRIVKSTNSLLMQHDAFSWVINDKSFVYENEYTEKSTRIVNTINNALTNYDDELKNQFIDTLFDMFDRLEIDKLPNEKEYVPFFLAKAPRLVGEWKNTPKEDRSVIKKIIFDLLKDYFLSK